MTAPAISATRMHQHINQRFHYADIEAFSHMDVMKRPGGTVAPVAIFIGNDDGERNSWIRNSWIPVQARDLKRMVRLAQADQKDSSMKGPAATFLEIAALAKNLLSPDWHATWTDNRRPLPYMR